jgi:hypothetical protein
MKKSASPIDLASPGADGKIKEVLENAAVGGKLHPSPVGDG